MKTNISKTDRVIRLLIAIVASILFSTQTVTGVLGYVVLAFGGIMLLTALVNFCPLYKLFKISSKKDN